MNLRCFLIAVAILLTLSAVVEGLKCWQCSSHESNDGTKCEKPQDEALPEKQKSDLKVDCGVGLNKMNISFCFIFTLPNGEKTQIVRGCKDPKSEDGEGCKQKTQATETCLCSTDLCNGGSHNPYPTFKPSSSSTSISTTATTVAAGGERIEISSFILLASTFLLGNMVWKCFEKLL